MADLSDLLGDVYGSEEETPIRSQPTPTGETPAPSWADEARLDGFFSGWLPGPAEDAVDREEVEDVIAEWPADDDPAEADVDDFAHVLVIEPDPELVADDDLIAPTEPHAVVDRLAPGGRLDDDLAEALSAALAAAPHREPTEATAVLPELAEPMPAASVDEVAAGPVEEPEVELPPRPWQRADDDLLPGRGRRRGLRRR